MTWIYWILQFRFEFLEMYLYANCKSKAFRILLNCEKTFHGSISIILSYIE